MDDKTKEQIAIIRMLLCVEINNKFVRGERKVRKDIESSLISQYNMEKRLGEYISYIPYSETLELSQKIGSVICEIHFETDLHNCFTELGVYCDELEL